jgi:hypothetical protein
MFDEAAAEVTVAEASLLGKRPGVDAPVRRGKRVGRAVHRM